MIATVTRDAARTVLMEIASVDLLKQPFNDYGNAQRIIARDGHRMRYCHAMRSWLVYDGFRWAKDEADVARGIAHEAILAFGRQALYAGMASATKYAGQSLNTGKLTSALTEAMPHLAISTGDLDTDPDLLNFRNGTLDLKTGELLAHSADRFITKIVHHTYNHRATCPRFDQFLTRIMDGDEDLIAYLQTALGYSLTGHTREKKVFIPLGAGDNGKSTLLSTVRALVAEYATLLQVETLMLRREETNNSQADLADLRGARFVVSSETEEGQFLSAARVKRITQGMGRIRTVRKYENPIEFDETHKLWIDTNGRPRIKDGDDMAIFNRLCPLLFPVRLPPEEIDRELPGKLTAEAEGILAWLACGAKNWYMGGLGNPEFIATAREEWREESDVLGDFISDRCAQNPRDSAGAQAVYADYRSWAESRGEKMPMTMTMFGRRMKKRYRHSKLSSGQFYQGISLKTDA